MSSGRRIVLTGGTGQIGTLLARHFHAQGDDVTVVSRSAKSSPWKAVKWDGATPGDWTRELERADVLINLAGRNVNCRYTPANRSEIMRSRVGSTLLLGQILSQLKHPPRIWMNASTATIYRHALDRPMDEADGEIGGNERGVPSSWRFSIEVATRWESTFFASPTPHTRKVALRSAMTMSPDEGGVFSELLRLVRFRLGGAAGPGNQYVSWIHEADFIRSLEFLVARDELDGPINIASPHPLPNREFMRALRRAWGTQIGLPATRSMLELGAFFRRTETELILKSRRVIPGRLLQAGFEFRFPEWPAAAQDLVRRWSQNNAPAQAPDAPER
jgi:uncharacterized protein